MVVIFSNKNTEPGLQIIWHKYLIISSTYFIVLMLLFYKLLILLKKM